MKTDVSPGEARDIIKRNIFDKVRQRFRVGDADILLVEKEVRNAIDKHTSLKIESDRELDFFVVMVMFLVQVKKNIVDGEFKLEDFEKKLEIM